MDSTLTTRAMRNRRPRPRDWQTSKRRAWAGARPYQDMTAVRVINPGKIWERVASEELLEDLAAAGSTVPEFDFTTFTDLASMQSSIIKSLVDDLAHVHFGAAAASGLAIGSSISDTATLIGSAIRSRGLAPAVSEQRPIALPAADVEVHGVRVPAHLRYLEDAISRSTAMLELEDNWDREGSPGYHKETWARAVTFLLNMSAELWTDKDQAVPVPRIGKGPEGSIDIHWQLPDRELLVNIAAFPANSMSFYGDLLGEKDTAIEGRERLPARMKWLTEWLAR